jgi:hypothetical protein
MQKGAIIMATENQTDQAAVETVSPEIADDNRWRKIVQLRAMLAGVTPGHKIGVDRKAKCIYGMILAQEGPFKSEGRGEFDKQAIQTIRDLAAASPNGLKSRFCHPDMSNDGLGKYLGRIRDPWIDTITRRESQGQLKTDPVLCVRGDLYFDASAFETPNGGTSLAEYVMTLAESDSDAVSSSLVLKTEQEYRIDSRGVPLVDENGDRLPPLWRPIVLHACDIVDTGDAVDGLLSANLSADDLPDAVVRQAGVIMNQQFAGKPREFVKEHCLAWLERYLDRTFGLSEVPQDGPMDEPEQEPCPAHDGCRSRHGLHYQKECRKCGEIIESCGCKDRLSEGRVIRMGTCEECLAKEAANDGLAGDLSTSPDLAADVQPPEPVGEKYDAERDPLRLRIALKIDTLQETLSNG